MFELRERHSRNIPSLSIEEMEKLSGSRVLVAGCGGLGGNIIEQLARAGVGSLTFQMTGDQEKVFHLYTGSFSGNASSIVYPCAGVYEYRVAFSSKAKSRRYALDTTRYLIRIYVKNMPDGSLQVERVACIDENHQKADEAVYHHTYQGKAPRPNPSILPKTGDTAMMVLWAAAFCVSLLLLILSLLRRRADRKV